MFAFICTNFQEHIHQTQGYIIFSGICPANLHRILKCLIQEKAKAPDFFGNIKVLSTMTIPAVSWSQIKSKVKILMDNDEQTIHFIPKIMENVDDCVNFSENVSNVKRGRTQ